MCVCVGGGCVCVHIFLQEKYAHSGVKKGAWLLLQTLQKVTRVPSEMNFHALLCSVCRTDSVHFIALSVVWLCLHHVNISHSLNISVARIRIASLGARSPR